MMIAEMFRKPTKWSVMKQLILKDIDDLVIDSLGIVAFISFFVGGVITACAPPNLRGWKSVGTYIYYWLYLQSWEIAMKYLDSANKSKPVPFIN